MKIYLSSAHTVLLLLPVPPCCFSPRVLVLLEATVNYLQTLSLVVKLAQTGLSWSDPSLATRQEKRTTTKSWVKSSRCLFCCVSLCWNYEATFKFCLFLNKLPFGKKKPQNHCWGLTLKPSLKSVSVMSTGSAMKGSPVLSLSSGPRGARGPSAAQNAGEASTQGSAPVRMATAVQDVHW